MFGFCVVVYWFGVFLFRNVIGCDSVVGIYCFWVVGVWGEFLGFVVGRVGEGWWDWVFFCFFSGFGDCRKVIFLGK